MTNIKFSEKSIDFIFSNCTCTSLHHLLTCRVAPGVIFLMLQKKKKDFYSALLVKMQRDILFRGHKVPPKRETSRPNNTRPQKNKYVLNVFTKYVYLFSSCSFTIINQASL